MKRVRLHPKQQQLGREKARSQQNMNDTPNTTAQAEQTVHTQNINLREDTANTTELKEEVKLGEPSREDKNSNTELNVSGTPDTLNPHIDWYYGEEEPVLYIYDAQSEEPAFLISLPTAEDPTARLIGKRNWTDNDWFNDK
ncbi:hypothetical protein [Salinibaculum rarum]|uniref:hypothetical protein n=1 Tax=Salinibaculum rarum TaxID=3058903 RepID=UPI00265E2C86|nr:hypothetical protein [Salinibaculum sp. KK48]